MTDASKTPAKTAAPVVPLVVESATPETPVTVETATPEVTMPIYPTEFYAASGIAHCPACGADKRTDQYGKVFCPQEFTGCPMVLRG